MNRRSVGDAPLPDELRTPHPARLPPSTAGYDEILAAHENAIAKGEPGYLDPVTGLFVMTAAYLWSAASAATPVAATARTYLADRELPELVRVAVRARHGGEER